MVVALVLSLAIVLLHDFALDQGLWAYEAAFIRSIDFSAVLMQGMLSLLLFAGALHIDLKELRVYAWAVAALVVVIAFPTRVLLAGLAAIVVTLLARWLTVGVPMGAAGKWFGLPAGSSRVLTWGGLRGGISVALALSLPAGPARDTVLALTYCVVVFSILAQGLTMGRLVRRVFGIDGRLQAP